MMGAWDESGEKDGMFCASRAEEGTGSYSRHRG